MAFARPFAYNLGGPISGTTQFGDLAVGTPLSGFTNAPLFWNGADEDLGYVIAVPVSGNTQPTPVSGLTASLGFFRTETFGDNEFIQLAEYVSREYGNPQSFSTAQSASTWLTNNGFWNSYSDVVTDGLTLQLDASNATSYPGSGNTWYDLVSPQQNITLVNSPTYTSTSPSYFSFNGSNQYGTGTGPVLSTTSYTKSVWFYLNSYTDNNLVSSENGGHFMYMAGTNRMYCGHTNWPSYNAFPSNSTFELNTWYYAALTFNTTDGMKLYVNGVLDSTYTANKSPMTGNDSTNLGVFGSGNFLNGRIARVFCYNKSLSDAEVLENYNGTKEPFISITPTTTPTPSVTQTPSVTPTTTQTPTPSITASQTVTPTTTPTPTNTPSVTTTNTPTNTTTPTPTSAPVLSNLVLYYDPSNPSSYSGTGTTINDLSGNGLSGTMSNITFTSPYFTYNGSSSQVSIADNALLEPGSGDWTIEFWVNHSVIAGSSRVLIGKTDGGNAADWGYGLRTQSNGNTFMEIGNGSTSITTPTSTLSINTWYQVVGVWTNVASNSLALYINGSLIGSNSHSVTSIKNTTRPLFLGSFDGGATFGQWLNGRMGIVRMYSSALSASQVLQNFNANKSKYGL